ncbi:uncharacterized protein LOC124794816 isoform X1 [Schistocerca piceifrons]|uniref:uncharacterized protein LOC124794816 isoform X1 n=1 Tax=Schistocerca piceifrons TaxID=274613 RepID=UPI001F5FC954|nr:uncharacterized protein LOC124794816 isoform X1 [Schistocerca piceifrons]
MLNIFKRFETLRCMVRVCDTRFASSDTKSGHPKRVPWQKKEGEWRSKLTAFAPDEGKAIGPDIINFFRGPLSFKQWFANVKEGHADHLQRFIPERHDILGCDLATAHFIVHRGGSVKFCDHSEWIKKDENDEYDLPNNGKLWRRRRRRPDLSHELDDSHQQATWVASYRVFSPLSNGESRPSPVLSPSSSFPLHPAPCMGLFLPAGSLPGPGAPAAPAAGSAPSPPSYEESLKHKVILSSYPLTVVLPPAGTPGSVGAALAPIPAVPTPAPSPGTPGD